MSAPLFITPEDIQEKAERYVERHLGEWAAALFLSGIDGARTQQIADCNLGAHVFRLGCPTEKQAMDNKVRTGRWSKQWQESDFKDLIEWVERNWPAAGRQRLPYRVYCSSWADVMRVARQKSTHALVESRLSDLIAHWDAGWSGSDADAGLLATAVRLQIRPILNLDDGDWRMLLAVIDWIAAKNPLTPYVRQLPIRGIHTKWMEQHGKLVKTMAQAVADRDFTMPKPLPYIHIRILDEALFISGFNDLEIPLDQVARLAILPDAVIVCENLVSLMTLPSLPKTIGIFGSGYAVEKIGSIPWLASIPVLYWGDLDTNGFAILHRLRRLIPHAQSVMMDAETLDRYLDLAVEEPAPNSRTFDSLTDAECIALDRLREGDPLRNISTLRLEQERIEWQWASQKLTTEIERVLGN